MTDSDRERAEEREEAKRLAKELAEKERPDTIRAEKTLDCLWWLVTVAKMQLNPVKWRNKGGPEVEDYLHAIETGRPHALVRWAEKRRSGGHPPPSLPEQRARIFVVLMCAALERVGCRKKEARERAATELASLDFFPGGPPSEDTIEHWQRQVRPLIPEYERYIANALKRGGRSEDAIAQYFVGLIRIVLDDAAQLRLVRKDDGGAR